MQGKKLARVRWEVGQTLLPEHFVAEGDALAAEARLSASLSGLPQTGIARLAWNEALLRGGTLSVSSLTAAMPGDVLVDVPGNAVLPPFSLDGVGKPKVAVHLHLLEADRSADGVPLYADESPLVKRTLRQLELSNSPVLDGASSSLKLGELVKDVGGVWTASPAFVPELVLAGPNPFLTDFFSDLDGLLAQAGQQLRAQIIDRAARSDRLTNARRTLFEVQALQGLRDDMKRGVHLHPYRLFEALRRLHAEAACYLEALPEEMFPGDLPVYRHDNLAHSLGGWIVLLLRSFRPEAAIPNHRPFEQRDGAFLLSPLPSGVPNASEVYLLVQQVVEGERIPAEGIKLASKRRLPIVFRLAIAGIPVTYVQHPAFSHRFGPEIDWYRLGKGEEWTYAVQDDSLAFHPTPALEQAQTFLYWREG